MHLTWCEGCDHIVKRKLWFMVLSDSILVLWKSGNRFGSVRISGDKPLIVFTNNDKLPQFERVIYPIVHSILFSDGIWYSIKYMRIH